MSMTYGKLTPTSYSDHEVIQVNKCLARLGVTMRPGAWLVDTYPILRYIPRYLTQLKEWHEEELQLFTEQLDVVKKMIVRPLQHDVSLGGRRLTEVLVGFRRQMDRHLILSQSIS